MSCGNLANLLRVCDSLSHSPSFYLHSTPEMLQFVLEQGVLLTQLGVELHTTRIALLKQLDHMLLTVQLRLFSAECRTKILELFVRRVQLIGYLLKTATVEEAGENRGKETRTHMANDRIFVICESQQFSDFAIALILALLQLGV